MANKKNIKKTSKKLNNKTEYKKKNLERKVFLFFASIIVLTLANFNILGIVGKYISGTFFALIGTPFYLITLSVIGLIIYAKTKNSKRDLLKRKFLFFGVIILSASSIIEFLFNRNLSFIQSVEKSFNTHVGGGVIGYGMSNFLVKFLSVYGFVVIVIILIAFSLLYITDFRIISRSIENIRQFEEKPQKKGLETKKIKENKPYLYEEVKRDRDNATSTDNFDDMIDKILMKEEDEKLSIKKEKVVLEKHTSLDNSLNSKNFNDDKNLNKVEKEVIIEPQRGEKLNYKFPDLSLLKKSIITKSSDSNRIKNLAKILKQTLDSFGVNAEISNISIGPSVTRFEIVPSVGVKVSKIVGLSDDIKLNLAAKEIRIEAPIPGKAAVGIEIPNTDAVTVRLRDILESTEFKNAKSKLSFSVGLNIEGNPVIGDIQKMPHVLIAGATGSGKSVCINSLIMSILFKARPDEVKLLMIDPKVVELSIYNGIPHLLIPVVTDPKRASSALNWAIAEMDKRYKLFAKMGVKDIFSYNEKLNSIEGEEKIPQIVIIIDELADLMMVASNEVEHAICRIAQLARACGIHLVIATQRPSVNVITGIIKANIPSRIAFAVSSGVDSRTIIDINGAEKLLGKGDMLYHPAGIPKPLRMQGAFVDENEILSVVKQIAIKDTTEIYKKDIEESIDNSTISMNSTTYEYDDYFEEAARIIIDKERASIGLLQRILKIGFNRAARIMDQLFEAGVVGPDEGTKPRKVLMNETDFDNYIKNR